MSLKRALLAIALCLGSALPASAYVIRRDARGLPVRWPAASLPVRYRVGVSGAAWADEALTGAVVRAFQAWNRVPGSYLRFRCAGRTDATRAAPDGDNCVIWITTGWPYRPETIAYTTVWLDGSSRVIDADIELNAEAFTWSPVGAPGAVDVQNTVAHEVGHFVALAHSLDSTETTMFPIILLGEVLKRSLNPDDVEGLRALYPVVSTELVLYAPAEGPPPRLHPVLDGLLAADASATPSIVLRADADGDGTDELALFRTGERPSFSILKPSPGDDEPVLVAYDEWTIAAGGEIEDAAALDVDGDGFEELVVLKYDPTLARQEVLVYPMPAWGAVSQADAQPALARDAWRIPEGNNLLALFALRRPGGGSLGVVRAADGALELELATPPRVGDTTAADAARGESVTVLLPEAFAATEIDAADLDGDGVDEVIVLDQDGPKATVRIYDLVPHADGAALMLTLRASLPVPLPKGERALGLVGIDLDASGLDRLGVLHAEIQ